MRRGPSEYSIDGMYDTYARMAEMARYRPAAPSDGCGNITVPEADLSLEREQERYAERWWAEGDGHTFWVGCCNGSTRPQTIFAIEAARLMCGGIDGDPFVLRLLKMAVADLERLAEREAES